MIERIVENWLTKSSERSYQLPFCYLLSQEGKTVIHLTRHCAMEQGKDIIALDQYGNPHAYQLKGVNGGRLKMSDWQEIQKQIYQLIFTPCSHPSIKSNEHHKSYLVVNGDIDEEVQHAIKLFNDDWDKKGQSQYRLELIVKGQILSMALEVKDSFVPTEINEFKSLLEFYLEDGIGFLDKEKFTQLLLAVIDKENLKSENEFKRLISSGALLCSLATSSFSNQNNHFALVEAWTIYLGIILRSIGNHKKKFADYNIEIELAKKIITNCLLDLLDEISDKDDFLQGDALSDAFVFKHRTTIVLGLMGYLGIINEEISYPTIDGIIQKQFSNASLWGESSLPFYLSLYTFYAKHDKKQKGLEILTVVVKNFFEVIKNSDIPFYDIYTSPEDSIIPQFSNFHKSNRTPRISYILEPLITLISQPELRGLAEENWSEVTRCIFSELVIDNKNDFYLWRVDQAEEITREPELTKSWNELLTEAKVFNIDLIPEGILQYPSFLPLFLMVFPHRLNSNMLKWYLDSIRTDPKL